MVLSLRDVVTLADADYLSARPLPSAPDGRYDNEVKPITDTTKHDPHSELYKVSSKLSEIAKNVDPILKVAATPESVEALLNAATSKDGIDDRKNLFTKAVAILCRLPEDSDLSKKLNDTVITQLYNTLPHPPATYVGTDYLVGPPTAPARIPEMKADSPASPMPRIPYTFRTADGSGNNPNMPMLGTARTPYARSVQNKYPLAANALPDPGDVFDALLKARDFQPHPNGNSSLTFAYASLVTHQLFRTDPRDMTKNNTTSYLDLSILYGMSEEDQYTVRDRDAGRGLLYPDAFHEDRLIFVPPAASALLVLFSRNHNYIAERILAINERGRWSDPPPEDKAKRALQDEEIFQIARLVNCGNFMAMIFGDYVAGFLGLSRDGSSWSMNPFDPITTPEGLPVTRGDGNHCSVEFNILYRWHATTAASDIKWTEEIFTKAFQSTGKPLDKLELKDFVPAVTNTWKNVEPDPRKRTFAGLQRGPDGRFSDDDLARHVIINYRVLQDATEKPAGTYRARGSPAVLRIVEMMGMIQARQWGVCTMNEFRTFLGLKRFESFEEWNPDKEIANAARQLYGHIDNLELYPGLQAEQIAPKGPGSGLCCGYTMMRAILSDAIALVRGDRFYTTDYTPGNLTAWGFQDCARDPNNGAFGAALPRLLFRGLPRHYPADSAYALFPFFTPDVTKTNLTNLKILDSYDRSRPVARPLPVVIDTVDDVARILKDSQRYKTFDNDLFTKTASNVSVLANLPEQRKAAVTQALFPTQDAFGAHKAWFGTKMRELIKERSYKIDGLAGSRLDIVGNVINLAPVHWVSEFILGIPLKTQKKPNGILTPQEVNDMLQLVFAALYLNVEPEGNWSASRRASYFAQILQQFVEKSLSDAVPHLSISSLSSFLRDPHKPAHGFLEKLGTSKAPHKDIVADIIGFAVTSSVSLAKTVSEIVDFYLDDKRAKERAEVTKLAGASDANSLDLLRGYVREAQRLAPQFGKVFKEEAGVASQQTPLNILNLKKALVDDKAFPDPLIINPRRPVQSYQFMQDASFYKCLGTVEGEEIVVEMVKAIFQLPDMRRVAGPAGTIGRVQVKKLGVDFDLYTNSIGLPDYWPSSLLVSYGS
ncbi:heme peroxidase [Trametes coccinea BRFM310]|uniref:Heme peroxidase n=1 Tax=Trametes coccinea (strain BRFM310) TaxID=1353009 RepID=A0A1Y2IKZ7_TRAC3|nr:heme peroxidase [Trametes coccinea BRFM310]